MRLLHTMLRVNNLQESLQFYCDVLGMKLLRQKDYPNGQFTLAFVGYGDEANHAVIELTYNWGVDRYEVGNAYGHIALGLLKLNGSFWLKGITGDRWLRASCIVRDIFLPKMD